MIEAPGLLGEARQVARRIRELLGNGVLPQRVLVTQAAHWFATANCWPRLDEYRVPSDSMEADELLYATRTSRHCLRQLRICEDDSAIRGRRFFADTLARPAWTDRMGDSDGEEPRRAEALLRMLGAPHGREAVLEAVDVWADNPPMPLEDEEAEESRRVRKAKLAIAVRPFIRRFLKAWDCFPVNGTPAAYAKALRGFAAEFSLVPVAIDAEPQSLVEHVSDALVARTGDGRARQRRAPRDQAIDTEPHVARTGDGRARQRRAPQDQALAEFFEKVDRWAKAATEKSLGRGAFFGVLRNIAASPRTVSRSRVGRVPLCTAETAVGLRSRLPCL